MPPPWHAVLWATYHAMLDAGMALKPDADWALPRRRNPFDALMDAMQRAREHGIDPVTLGQAARERVPHYAETLGRWIDA